MPLVIEALRVIAFPVARRRLFARTAIWVCVGLLSTAALIFALIGLHGLIASSVGAVGASFIMALILLVAAGLLALGAWLARPRRRHPPPRPGSQIALLAAGFLAGLSERPRSTRRTGSRADDPDH